MAIFKKGNMQTYYDAMKDFPEGEYALGEMAFVNAGIGGQQFVNTKEIHAYNEAMQDKENKQWEIAVNEEHEHCWNTIYLKIWKAAKHLRMQRF